MTYSLFIDDERFPEDVKWAHTPGFYFLNDWEIVRTVGEAESHIECWGCPKRISFDHDLGGDEKATTIAHWLIARLMDELTEWPEELHIYVHSKNPVGAANIESLWSSFFKAYGHKFNDWSVTKW